MSRTLKVISYLGGLGASFILGAFTEINSKPIKAMRSELQERRRKEREANNENVRGFNADDFHYWSPELQASARKILQQTAYITGGCDKTAELLLNVHDRIGDDPVRVALLLEGLNLVVQAIDPSKPVQIDTDDETDKEDEPEW
jgi:hypothetical protein